MERSRKFFEELKRRRALRALGAYAIAAFALLQVAEPIVHGLGLPEWVIGAVVITCAAGFPVAFVLAWTFDLTWRGVERTPDVPPTPRPITPPAVAPAVQAGAMTALLDELARAPDVALQELRPLQPGETVGRFEILREIGRGGFGVVYEARDGGLGRLVALKTVQPRRGVDPAMLGAEAEAAAQLQHPNIVTVHDVGTDGSRAWIVLELLRGETLQDRLRRGPMTQAEALRTSLGLARGLAHAHRGGIVHRDLKTANVFLCEDGSAKILDFGLSRVFGSGGLEGGTPGYMAPEQARGQPQDARTDVFAAAVMLFEMLTGGRPYPVIEGRSSVLDAARPPRLTVSAPAALRTLLAAGLHPDPARRPRDGTAWLGGLLAVEAAGARRRSRRSLTLGAAGAALTAALIVGLAWGRLAPRGPPESEPAARIPVAVADVHNGTSDPELDGLSGMLVTSLEQSRSLLVLTRSRLVDAIRQLGKEPPAVVDEPLAREIGRSLGVKALLLATVHRFDDLYAIELRALDPSTNEYLFTVKEQARGKASVPELIDRLARTARDRLATERSEVEGSRRAVADLTTSNLAAYERYFNARRAIDLRQFDLARRELGAALAEDPAFALARYAQTVLDSWTHPLGPAGLDGPEARGDRERLEAAVQVADRLPERERLGLLAWKATAAGDNDVARKLRDEAARAYPQDKDAVFWAGDQRFHAGDPGGAIPYFERALTLDPDYRLALEHMVHAAAMLGRDELELRYARRWAETAGTVESRFALAQALVSNGQLEEAQRMCDEAAGGRWTAPGILIWLARQGRVAEAEARARAVLASPVPPGVASLMAESPHDGGPVRGVADALEALLVLQGRVHEAEALSAPRYAARPERERLARLVAFAFVSRDLARARATVRTIEEAPGPVDSVMWAQAVAVLGVTGAPDEARALEPRIRSARDWTLQPDYLRTFVEAIVAMGTGRPGDAEQGLRTTSGIQLPVLAYQSTVLLGELLVKEQRPREALPLLKRSLALRAGPDEQVFAWLHPIVLLRTAEAQEAAGAIGEARRTLDQLLQLWDRADPDLPLVMEARELRKRLAAFVPGQVTPAPAPQPGAQP